MSSAAPARVPGPWQAVAWAAAREANSGALRRARLVSRTVLASLAHRQALERWMAVVHELALRGLVHDARGEYLRAVRPYVNRHTRVPQRVAQLVDQADWLQAAFTPQSLQQLAAGEPVVLADLPPPRGYEFMRLQLLRAPSHSPEGELMLTLTMQRSAVMQHRAPAIDAAAIAFSRLRVGSRGCLAIGGVRGQRHPVQRISPVELEQALQGWKASVLLVRVMQELARAWGLTLLGLDPQAHRLRGWSFRWRRRHRERAARLFASYDALWAHFEARPGPPGWMAVPLDADHKLAATALSPEKRERQSRRADYWIRLRRLLHRQLPAVLLAPAPAGSDSGNTQSPEPSAGLLEAALEERDALVPSRVLQTAPGQLV